MPKIVNMAEVSALCSETERTQASLRIEGKKWCCSCKTIKPLDDFHTANTRPDGKKSTCKDCTRTLEKSWRRNNEDIRRIKRNEYSKEKRAKSDPRFMVTKKICSSRRSAKTRGHQPCIATINDLVPLFTTKCQICGAECGNSICLDHCHRTGKFRGFICVHCNTIIGYSKDSVEILEKVILYLKQ